LTLAWNLGINPLLKDLETASQLLQSGLLTHDWNLKSVARYGRVVNDVDKTEWPNTGVRQTSTISENHGYTVTLVGRPKATISALLSALGLTNLPSIAYQATSCTFIVDYFLALGPWLEAVSVPKDFEFVEGSWTQKVTRIVTQTVLGSGEEKMVGSYVLDYTRRKLYSGFPFPLPPLSFREKDLAEKQLLNTGLVAVQKIQQLLR
jgi:hypothetical protein